MIIGFEARNQKPVRYALEESVKESGNMKMFHFPFPVGDNGNIIVAMVSGHQNPKPAYFSMTVISFL